ncbi:MAG: YkgJ family cysteine cluster protein [Candidatus Woesearchaeota archaeon]
MPKKDSRQKPENISTFVCKRCGECCQYLVQLEEKDIIRIREAGYSDFYYDEGERKVLKRKNGYCIFYKEGCTIYPIRPKVCRDYPFNNTDTVESCRPSDDPLLKKYLAFKNLK